MAFGDIIQSAQNGADGVSSITVTIASAVAGNLLVCGHFTGDGNSIAPTGYAEAVAVTNGPSADQGAIYWKIAAGGETTVIPSSGASDENMAIVVEIEGPWETAPVDVTATNGPNTAVTTQSSGTTATTAQNNEVAVALICARWVNATFSGWTNSFVERGEVSSGIAKSVGLATKLLTTTGTQETTATASASNTQMGCIATFLEAAAGGTTYSKLGGGLSLGSGLGADVAEFSEIGAGLAIGVGSGADVFQASEAGEGLSVGSGGGGKLRDIPREGGALSG